MRLSRLLLAVLSCLAAAPASASWLRATTQHFVVYDNTGEGRLREKAIELERFNAVLQRFHHLPPNPDDVFNKVTIFTLDSVDDLQELAGNSGIAGYYQPHVTGSVAFTPHTYGSAAKDPHDLNATIVLQHEYAHHFMFSNTAFAYPLWFSEGYAEFVSTVQLKNKAFIVGMAANHRSYSLLYGPKMSAAKLFDPPKRMSGESMAALYARGWLLVHYCMFDEGRHAKLNAFLKAFNAGTPAARAATEAFGDLRELDRALDKYLHSNLPALGVAPADLGNPEVKVTPLTAGEAALIGYRMASTSGVNAAAAKRLYVKVAPVAAAHATDATAQGWFAEMAYDADQLDAADKAAEAAIAADPTSSQGLLYKARIAMKRLAANKVSDPKQWSAARNYIVRANKAQPNDAAALRLYYDSFTQQNVAPTESAKDALFRALELVPQDPETRGLAAQCQLLDGNDEDARRLLRPVAFSPHAPVDNYAARLLAAMDAGKRGRAAIDAAKQELKDEDGKKDAG